MAVVAGPAIEAGEASSRDGLAELVDAVRDAAATRTPLALRGGGTKAWYGNRPDAALPVTTIDTRVHRGIVDYEPSELVLVARAGTPLADVEALLAQRGQMLAFEPPRFEPVASVATGATAGDDLRSRARALQARSRATVGGCIAAGLSGPRRATAGAVRDFVLGTRLVDGRGRALAFGGQVMKNVAGYDVSRALVGSLGILGVVTEVSLKVLPKPPQSVTLAFAFDEATALERVNGWAGAATAIGGTAWRGGPDGDGRLLVRLEGSEPAVQSTIRRLGGFELDAAEADAAWLALREQTHAFFDERPADATLWRLSLPSTAPALDARRLGFDDQLIEWGGAQRWIATRVDPALVRAAAASVGGHATIWRGADAHKRAHGTFAPLSAPVMAIHRRLKAEFDPHGLFNRGRLYADL